MQIIFRDDDTSFFTHPTQLEAIYAPVWDRNLPVCLAVIPAHSANILIRNQPERFDPNIPPSYRGQDQTFPITDNPDLCAYLNDLARQRLVEICLHGYAHTWMECVIDDPLAFTQLLIRGKSILACAFPDADVQTVIPPYGCMSAEALDVISHAGLNVVASPSNWPTIPLLTGFPSYTCSPLPQGGRLWMRGDPTNPISDPAAWLDQLQTHAHTDDMLLCTNHYWQFYGEWSDLDADRAARWREFLDVLLPDYAFAVTTFSESCAITHP